MPVQHQPAEGVAMAIHQTTGRTSAMVVIAAFNAGMRIASSLVANADGNIDAFDTEPFLERLFP
jgi:hypothetical protein